MQVWKIIFFFHTNRPKKEFFPDWKMTKFFHTFQDSVGTLHFCGNCQAIVISLKVTIAISKKL